MMGLIEEMKGGAKRYGPGHFDLIVIDEAHRSVYRKGLTQITRKRCYHGQHAEESLK